MKKQSRQLGASKKDAFPHTSWNLDLRTQEEKEMQKEGGDSKSKPEVGQDEHVYDDVCTTTMTPVEIQTKVIQTDDIEKNDQMVQVQESKLELQDIEDNKIVDDNVNENTVEESHIKGEDDEEIDQEAMKLKKDIADAIKAMPNFNL